MLLQEEAGLEGDGGEDVVSGEGCGERDGDGKSEGGLYRFGMGAKGMGLASG